MDGCTKCCYDTKLELILYGSVLAMCRRSVEFCDGSWKTIFCTPHLQFLFLDFTTPS